MHPNLSDAIGIWPLWLISQRRLTNGTWRESPHGNADIVLISADIRHETPRIRN